MKCCDMADEMERLRDKISDREKMITWALQKISTLKKEIDALKAQDGSCESCRWMNEDETGPHCKNCIHNAKDNYQPMTNHDRLRMMTARELAQWIDKMGVCPGDGCPAHDDPNDCKDCADRIEEWLSQSVENQRSESNAAL